MKLNKKETAIISKLLDLVNNTEFVMTRINDNQDCYNNVFLNLKDINKFMDSLKKHEVKNKFNIDNWEHNEVKNETK